MATTINWPTSLPQSPLVEGFADEKEDITIRIQMEYGFDKVRKRFSFPIGVMTFPILLTSTQVQTLDDFYNTTLLAGQLTFNVTNPRLQITVEAMILQRPQYVPVSAVLYKVDLKLRYRRPTISTPPVEPPPVTGIISSHIHTGQQLVNSVGPILLVPARVTRRRVILIAANDKSNVYYGEFGVTQSTGILLPGIMGALSRPLVTPNDVYAISAGATVRICFIEEYD